MTRELTKKCGYFNSEYCRYVGREGIQIFIIQQVHVKFINITKKTFTKCIQRTEDLENFAKFIQNAYTIAKRTKKKGQRNTEKKLIELLNTLPF